jgi:hypothetical protein
MQEKLTLIENEYASLWYYPATAIIHHQFLQPVFGDVFRSVLMTGLELMKKHGAQKWLSDDRQNTILPPDDAAWSQERWLEQAYQAGWKYWAVVPPVNARGRINMERLVAFVGENKRMRIQIFRNPDKAWQWLVNQDDISG